METWQNQLFIRNFCTVCWLSIRLVSDDAIVTFQRPHFSQQQVKGPFFGTDTVARACAAEVKRNPTALRKPRDIFWPSFRNTLAFTSALPTLKLIQCLNRRINFTPLHCRCFSWQFLIPAHNSGNSHCCGKPQGFGRGHHLARNYLRLHAVYVTTKFFLRII
jgi:hypothetical protein